MDRVNPPCINIERVENFYGFETDFDNSPLERGNAEFAFPSSKSKRRAIRRRLKKIVTKARRVYEEMVQDDCLLDDHHLEQEM